LHRRRPARQHFGCAAAAPAAQVVEDIDVRLADPLGDGVMGLAGDFMQHRCPCEPLPDGASVIGTGGKQVDSHSGHSCQRFEKCHDQRAGRVRAEAVGKQAQAQCGIGGGHRRRHRLQLSRDHSGACPGASQLLVWGGGFG
jgi:hypothetical protein